MVGNQVAAELDDKVGDGARVTGGDRFASAADANFGINFTSNRLVNVVGGDWHYGLIKRSGEKLLVGLAPLPDQKIEWEVVGGIGTKARSTDQVERCCQKMRQG